MKKKQKATKTQQTKNKKTKKKTSKYIITRSLTVAERRPDN